VNKNTVVFWVMAKCSFLGDAWRC